MAKRRDYIGVSQDEDGSWIFTVRKVNGKIKTGVGYSTSKVAALMRDEYILKHNLEEKSNFPVKRMAKMRNEAYEQMFGSVK
ncbi:AP2 domain-containing protein [Candidatus Electrothrix laxa]